MNNIFLSSNFNNNVVYETLEKYWMHSPYKFRIGPKDEFDPNVHYVHKDIEINYLVEGEMIATLDGKPIQIKKGDVYCVNQYVSHSMEFLEKPRYALLVISTKFLKEHGLDPSKLWFEPFISDEKVQEIFSEMIEANSHKKKYSEIFLQGCILKLVSYIANNYSEEMPEGIETKIIHSYGLEFDYVRHAIDYIVSNLHEAITIEDISSAVGISKFYLSRIFKKNTKFTTVEYINKMRCDYAKILLSEEGANVTDVAIACGFNNMSYFSKIFQKNTGKLPSEYLKYRKAKKS